MKNSNESVFQALLELLKPEIDRISRRRSQFTFSQWKYLLRAIETDNAYHLEFELTSSRLGSKDYQIIS